MNLVPRKDRVIVQPIQQSEQTNAGVVIPEESRKLIDEGRIIAVGSDVTDYSKGDQVVYSRYAGTFIKVNAGGAGALGEGENLLILDTDDILATVVRD